MDGPNGTAGDPDTKTDDRTENKVRVIKSQFFYINLTLKRMGLFLIPSSGPKRLRPSLRKVEGLKPGRKNKGTIFKEKEESRGATRGRLLLSFQETWTCEECRKFI